jgi:hypothetical protein
MHRDYPNDVIARARAREVTARVRGADHLDAVMDHLLENGIDRADLDLVAGPALAGEVRRNAYTAADAANVSAAVVGSTMAVGALGMLGVGMLAGASAPVLATVALTAAAVGLGVGTVAAYRYGERRRDRLHADLARGRLMLATRVRGADDEARVRELLHVAGAGGIEAREVWVERRSGDIPLSRLRPDPWLGDERLAAV